MSTGLNILLYVYLVTPIADLFTIVRKRKQTKCPSTHEWIVKMRYIYTSEFYPGVKKSEICRLIDIPKKTCVE